MDVSTVVSLIYVLCFAFVITSQETVWPLPKYITTRSTLLVIDPRNFDFKITNLTCDILTKAVKRYSDVINQTAQHILKASSLDTVCDTANVPQPLKWVNVELTNPCEEWPHLNMAEHYEMYIGSPEKPSNNVITSSSVWGVLRGLETFSQLLTPSANSSCLVINSTRILDYPRFRHRGLLLDTSRHFLPMSIIYNILSAMEMNKMNVFHWHIVDDQSFPYQSTTFPSLSDYGAYNPKTLIYTQENISSIIEYARLRGIRVIPEFDTPGHTLSWGKGVPKLLTSCYSNGTFNGKFGPVDPSRNQNYKFINDLFQEVKKLFPDQYIHIGGDEVSFDCWKSNPSIQQFMKEKNITSYDGLEDYYIKQVLEIVQNISAKGIVWQEVFQNNVTLRNDTVVHIWLGDREDLLNEVTKKGHFALLSEGWYLDHLDDSWQNFYKVDPSQFNGTTAQKALVLGGEACMWGEMVDESNIVSRTWPRASAIAERLWSSKQTSRVAKAMARLDHHVCRMKRRGVAAAPANGPGFCPY